MPRSVRRLFVVVLASLCAAVVAVLGVVATGTAALVITHGVSMEPVYRQGDLVVVLERPAYTTGDIAAYARPGYAGVVLHRIVGGDARGYTFKGDNNASVDPTTPSVDQLTGRAVLHLPQAGLWFQRLTSPPALAGATFLLVGASGAVQTRRDRKRRTTVSRHTAPTALSVQRFTTLPVWLRVGAGVGAVAVVVSVAVGAAAWTTPVAAAAVEQQVAEQSMTFAYSATVEPSAAYDGTTAVSPDPVFRRLADTVDVHLDYRGQPGAIAVRGELSTPSGWHTTIPLAPVTEFDTPRYEVDVTLDLAALEQRANDAAAATGIPAGQISLDVVADVSPSAQTSFAPSLALSLSPLQLTLPGGATSLTVQDTPGAPVLEQPSGELSLLGRTAPVEALRVGSALGLVAGLLVLTAVFWLGRRLAPSTEAAGIRRRYASLIVAVEPILHTPGRPVIDVTEFATLAKLAERYGLLVLHWSRSGIETFVVQDESTTFRFRTGSGGDGSGSVQDPSLARVSSKSMLP